jgi:hypothetical protein
MQRERRRLGPAAFDRGREREGTLRERYGMNLNIPLNTFCKFRKALHRPGIEANIEGAAP